jgi:4-hydroxythreonine-4-phosphate dehydrogenase
VTPVRLAITLGDPAGIGPEVVVRALAALPRPWGFRPVLVGPAAALERELAHIDTTLETPLTPVPVAPGADPFGVPTGPNGVALVDPAPGAPLPAPGAPSPAGGRAALAALEAAVDLGVKGAADAIVTAPLSKAAVRMAGRPGFVGHTEHLAARTGGREVRMMMVGGGLRVVLVTSHVALAEVPARIHSEGIFLTIRLAHDALVRNEGISRPRIAVCGLNPHPGEFGTEDDQEVAPGIELARAEGIRADGPLAADGLFARVRELGYDAVVAMYHDQGLGPVKLLDPDGVVNVTLGLPFVRTAPGHGTAFDLAGKGKARGTGMAAAIALAARWAAVAATLPEGE